MEKGKWSVLLFYLKDFTVVCPTEITAISDRHDEFTGLDTVVVGISTDTIHPHLAWSRTECLKR